MLAAVSATLLCVMFLSGCGKSKEQEAVEAFASRMAEAAKKMESVAKPEKSDVPHTPEQAMKKGAAAMAAAAGAMGAMMGGGDGKVAVEPINFRELKTLLPESIGGMKRENSSGETTATMGMKVSHVKARYTAGKGTQLRLKITDTGSMSGFAGLASAGWAMVEIDRESDTGYEKTSTVNGRKMHEKWNSKRKRGEVDMIVGGRFILELRGTGMEMEDLKQALAAIDLKKPEGLKSAAPAAAASK
jgi:hypothetical protein